MDELLDYPDLNLKYINKINTNLKREAEMISNMANISIEEHATTSCYFTALLIRWLVSDQEWIKVPPEYVLTNETIYQVVIGENEIDDQHYLTVFNNNIIFQSFWGEYTLQKIVIPDLNILLKSRDWLKLTQVENSNWGNYKCLYYVPIHKYNETDFLRKLYSIT